MTFNDNARLDAGQVRGASGGGGGRGMLIGGGGLGSLVILLLMFFFGGGGGGTGGGQQPQQAPPAANPFDTSQVTAGGDYEADLDQRCQTGADANTYDDCRVVGTVNSVQQYWKRKLPTSTSDNTSYTPIETVLYKGSTQSACGTASNQVGPFYCPGDPAVFMDVAFFDLLSEKYGADGGNLAQMYIVAHEYGHAVQDQLGLLRQAQQDREGADSGSVRLELMADCMAGMWAKDASSTTDEGGTALIEPLTQADIDSALSAAASVGDDHIQKQAGMRVDPESFTHGTSAQRQQWFMTGYQHGDLARCNTFNVRTR